MSTAVSDVATRGRAYWDRLAWGAGELRRWLGSKGLWPEVTRLASTAQGARWRIVGDKRIRAEGGDPEALLIGESDVLWGSLQLPGVTASALDGAVAEALWRVSPIPPDQVISAWRAQPNDVGGWQISWGVFPLRQVDQVRVQLQLAEDVPIYLAGAESVALLAQGPAQLEQRKLQRKLDASAMVGLGLVALALAVPLIMPLVLKRQAVTRAVAHMASVEPMATPVREKLDELHSLSKMLDALTVERQQSLPIASTLDRLAASLPADAWLDRLEASDRQVRFMGLASNATELMAQLSKVSEFAELHTTAPTVRDEGQNRERFSFEFTWNDIAIGASAK